MRRWDECDPIDIVDDAVDPHVGQRLGKRVVANHWRAKGVDAPRCVQRGGQRRERATEAMPGHEERNVNVLECCFDFVPDDVERVFEPSVDEWAGAEEWNRKLEIGDQIGRFLFRAAEDQRRPFWSVGRLNEHGLRVGLRVLFVEEFNLFELLWSEEFAAQ